MIPMVLGGIGLFLLGMILLTDGLKAIAGPSINRVLTRFTRRPIVGIFSGALVTALVQSSSVTTLMTVGFVSAGLLTFTQTLGVIMGVNLGTTSTGWIVSQIGFKVNVSAMAFPLIALGTVAKIAGNGKVAHLGSTLAGFGLILLGISAMQDGMAGLSEHYEPSNFPGGSVLSNLLLVGIGVIMTVVMQSSSAAMATTLAALYSQAIALDQAAALVIGQNVGTTVTIIIAALGATVAAKQTAVVHVMFNFVTAIVAFLMLPYLIQFMEILRDTFLWEEATTLAAFHTIFNCLGVAIFFPLIGVIASTIQKVMPDLGPQLVRHLNPRLVRIYSAAIEAARQSTLDVAKVMIALAYQEVTGKVKTRAAQEQLRAASLALAETRRFLADVHPEEGVKLDQQRHVSVFHAIDHLWQLEEALNEAGQAGVAMQAETCKQAYIELVEVFEEVIPLVESGDLDLAAKKMENKSKQIADIRRNQRREVLDNTAKFQINADLALLELEAMRWLDRLGYHVWRTINHLRPEGVSESEERERLAREGGEKGDELSEFERYGGEERMKVF
ncbi:MAG: Na/Pi cotransporter family protein [Anaerolineales bacterium]|nr:Na/Pi cotransporter family protein [Anaerolineales bacterium]